MCVPDCELDVGQAVGEGLPQDTRDIFSAGGAPWGRRLCRGHSRCPGSSCGAGGGEEVGSGVGCEVGCSAPRVPAEHGFVVAVGVDGGFLGWDVVNR